MRADLERIVAILNEAGLTPPTVAELEQATGLTGVLGALRFGAKDGRVIAVESDRYFCPTHLNRFLDTIRELGAQGSLTPPAIRDRTGLSRKYLIPLLEYADRVGVTRRVGMRVYYVRDGVLGTGCWVLVKAQEPVPSTKYPGGFP